MTPPRYAIALPAWIIQDGNYGEFAVGDVTPFALNLQWDGGDSGTEVRARAIWMEEQLVVLDVGGLLAYALALEPGWRVGEPIRAGFHLEVDCFEYFEKYTHIPGFPALIYTWRIERITRGGVEQTITNAWDDDGGQAVYRLECERLPAPPRRTLEADSATLTE